MSDNRITLHLALELARRGGGTGAAAFCGGGGQGNTIIMHHDLIGGSVCMPPWRKAPAG